MRKILKARLSAPFMVDKSINDKPKELQCCRVFTTNVATSGIAGRND
jgi:hypothetical protein